MILVDSLPPKVRLIALFDSCSSGTILGECWVPYSFISILYQTDLPINYDDEALTAMEGQSATLRGQDPSKAYQDPISQPRPRGKGVFVPRSLGGQTESKAEVRQLGTLIDDRVIEGDVVRRSHFNYSLCNSDMFLLRFVFLPVRIANRLSRSLKEACWLLWVQRRILSPSCLHTDIKQKAILLRFERSTWYGGSTILRAAKVAYQVSNFRSRFAYHLAELVPRERIRTKHKLAEDYHVKNKLGWCDDWKAPVPQVRSKTDYTLIFYSHPSSFVPYSMAFHEHG